MVCIVDCSEVRLINSDSPSVLADGLCEFENSICVNEVIDIVLAPLFDGCMSHYSVTKWLKPEVDCERTTVCNSEIGVVCETVLERDCLLGVSTALCDGCMSHVTV